MGLIARWLLPGYWLVARSFSPVVVSVSLRLRYIMTPLKALAVGILLCCLLYAAESQPTAFEPVLPPIPDPPYPHKVRFCGIADNATFSLNSTTLNQCNWKRYIQVRCGRNLGQR